MILLYDTNVIKSFEMTLNWKYSTEKLKTKKQRHGITKNQNAWIQKPSFKERIGRKCRIT